MPGLAASSLVFENIRLENPNYQLYRLDWIQPKKNESIKSYCLRLSKKLPFGMFDNFIKFSLKLNINKLYKRIDLAERYLTERDEKYLEWAVWTLLNWRQDKFREDIIHIHGEKDKVFPIDNISNCIRIKGGRHEMIILRAKWFNENLVSLIER